MASLTELQSLLASTAHWTAAVRARESEREDRLFSDPFAAAMAGEVGAAWIAARPPDSTLPIALRTRYFDDYLGRVTAEDGIRQVLLPGAGLDTRAYRLAWPVGTRLFEIDQPAIMAHKKSVFDATAAVPGCERLAIEADLSGLWVDSLLEAGFRPEEPTVWLLEGLLFYLPVDRITAMLDAVSPLSALGSRLGFDIINSAVLTSPFTKPWVDMQAAQGAPWIGTMDDPVAFLAERGWAAELSQAGAADANHGRWTLPVVPTTMPNFPHNWYVTAQKKG